MALGSRGWCEEAGVIILGGRRRRRQDIGRGGRGAAAASGAIEDLSWLHHRWRGGFTAASIPDNQLDFHTRRRTRVDLLGTNPPPSRGPATRASGRTAFCDDGISPKRRRSGAASNLRRVFSGAFSHRRRDAPRRPPSPGPPDAGANADRAPYPGLACTVKASTAAMGYCRSSRRGPRSPSWPLRLNRAGGTTMLAGAAGAHGDGVRGLQIPITAPSASPACTVKTSTTLGYSNRKPMVPSSKFSIAGRLCGRCKRGACARHGDVRRLMPILWAFVGRHEPSPSRRPG